MFKQLVTKSNAVMLKIASQFETYQLLYDTYGKVAQKPLNEQTSAIYNILQEFEGRYSEDIAAIGGTLWVNELKARNNAFAELMRERFEEGAVKCDIVLKEARAELNASYRAIRERINALIVVEGEASLRPGRVSRSKRNRLHRI